MYGRNDCGGGTQYVGRATGRVTGARRSGATAHLAVDARISLSTLEKGLAGERPFTLATNVRLEGALDTTLRDHPAAVTPPLHASPEVGAYRREAVEWIAGTYLTLRPSFEKADAVYAYLTQVEWDERIGCLVFRESQRLDACFAQKGTISMPYQSGHVYLVTNDHGQYRVAMLSRPSITGDMYGLLTTLRSGRGGRLTPVAARITLIRQRGEGEIAPTLGLVTAQCACFAAYKAELDRVRDEEFSLLL